MFDRLLPSPSQSFFLLGPRGTGKTTWLRAHFPRAKTIDLLDEGRYQALLADPGLFEKELNALPAGSWVVVDEIQRLPNLLNVVHRLIEDRGLRFALTGSSARKLRRSGVNLLAGRAIRKEMFPLSPQELGAAFDLDRALEIGTLPLVWTSADPEASLEAYAQMYLKEEIQAEALVRNLSGFARFLPVSALFHAQTLNVSALARDAGVSRPTVCGYLEILEDTLLARRLPAYEGRLRVREKRHPKLYWIDPGLVRALKGVRGRASPEERGGLLEGFVWMLLRLYRNLSPLYDDLRYWSPAEALRTEVDFLLIRGQEKVAIEVKASARFQEGHLQGLRAIHGLAGLRRRILVYRGDQVLKTSDGIEVWPFASLCAHLEGGTL